MLLLRVTQANGRPLFTGGFMCRAMIQMICDITGVIPKEADILTNQEVVLEIEDQSSIIQVSRAVQGLFHWGGQAITVDSVAATQDSITEITEGIFPDGLEKNRKYIPICQMDRTKV